MKARIVHSFVVLAFAVSTAGAQNTVQWDRLVPGAEVGFDPPAVRVWMDQRAVGWGEPIRVGFSVEEDAFVVVARVDWQGNLTVLYPSNRNRVTLVKGGEDTYIRGARTGGAATFLAAEQPGATGYVFAIASRTPMDLSRLSIRDFSTWVTGVSVGQSAQRYIGDPYRVIQRFARLVSYSDDAEFDYDMEFYSVDQPRFAASSAYAGFGYCNSSFGRDILNQELYGSLLGFNQGAFLDCRSPSFCFSQFSLGGFGVPLGFLSGSCGSPFGQQVAVNGQNPVVSPPPIRGTGPVNPWAGDSIQRPNLDRSGQGGSIPDRHNAVDLVRPVPVAVGSEDLSFSIPSRALRGLRERSDRSGERLPNRPDQGGSIPNPGGRPTPVVAENSPSMEWVRPPRSFDGPGRGGEPDRLPSRGAIRRESAANNPPTRGFDYNPPPRSGSVMFDREVGGMRGYTPPTIDYRGGQYNGGSVYSPPNFNGSGGRPMTDPGMSNPGTIGGGGAPPIRSIETSSPPPTPPASSSSGGASSAEKKPGA